jgi:hypothetical protein
MPHAGYRLVFSPLALPPAYDIFLGWIGKSLSTFLAYSRDTDNSFKEDVPEGAHDISRGMS